MALNQASVAMRAGPAIASLSINRLQRINAETLKAAGIAYTRRIEVLQSALKFDRSYIGDLERLYDAAGQAAMAAALQEYRETVGSNGHLQYRANEQRPRLTGKLEQALKVKSNMYRVFQQGDGTVGLAYPNINRLMDAAAQVRRLNFGAGGRRGGRPLRPFYVDFPLGGGDVGAFAISLNVPQSPPVLRPFGFFFDAEGPRAPDRNKRGASTGNPFYPVRGRATIPTIGIKPQRFLDAGYGAIADVISGRGSNPSGIAGYAAIIRNYEKHLKREQRRRSAGTSANPTIELTDAAGLAVRATIKSS